ncbi:MAG: hypothetical protein IIB53_00310 [Planctomycetes bacterium]|nr:hypothetical protein [Planctomycetota bacterium]
MPENDPQDQTDLPGESTNHGTDDSAVPSDQGADSADTAGAPPTPESLPADSVDLDQSLSKIDQLSQALAKLSQASADDGFADKMRQLTREASEAQDKAGDQPRSEAPTEQSQEPVEPTLPTQLSDEQLSASEPDETAPAETVLDAADIAPLHEAFDPSPLDDIVADLADDGFDVTSEAIGWESTDEEAPSDAAPVQAGADDAPGFEFEAPESSFDVAVPPQPLAEDIWETEESDSPEAMTTEHQSDEPPIGGQQSSSVADTLQNEHEVISDSAGADGREALSWASESDSEEEEIVGAPMESLDEIEVDAEPSPEVSKSETAGVEAEAAADADPPAEMFESVAQEPEVSNDMPQEIEQDAAGPDDEQTDDEERPDTLVDTEAAPVGADQPDESATAEQDSEAETSGGATTATDVGDPEPELVRDESASDSPRATFTAEELKPQITELLESMGDVQPTAPRRVPQISAQGPAAGGLADDQPAPSAPTGSVDLDWLTKELDEMLNPGAQDSASVDQPAVPQTDDALIDGAAEQDDPTPELPDQESSPSDESSLEVDASVSTVPEPDDGPRPERDESEQAEVVSSIDALEPATPQEEIAPTEPIDADISNGDESLQDSEPSGSADTTLDDLTAQLDDLVQPEVEASAVQANAPKEMTEAVAADEPPQDTSVRAIEAPPPSASDAIEPDEPASSADDELADITAQLDELLDADDDSSPQQTPIDVAEETPAVIDTAAPPGETEAASESIEAAAPPPDEDLAEIDKTLAAEVAELIEGVGDSPEGAANDDLGEPAASAGDSEPQMNQSEVQSEDPASSDAVDDIAEPAALDSERAAESETDFTMDVQESAEAESQPEAEASNEFADEPEPESAPEAQVESEPPSQDEAESKRASAKDDEEDPRASQTEELKEAAVAAVRFARLHGALQRIEPVAVPVLRRVNYPLRYVPQTMRPIVDWIALSLLFWVPIVWAIALLAG